MLTFTHTDERSAVSINPIDEVAVYCRYEPCLEHSVVSAELDVDDRTGDQVPLLHDVACPKCDQVGYLEADEDAQGRVADDVGDAMRAGYGLAFTR